MFDDAKRQVAVAPRVLADLGLASGAQAALGEISLRIADDSQKFAARGQGYTIDTLNRRRPEDIVVMGTDGGIVDGPLGISASAEWPLHAAIFSARPEVQAVVHVHGRFVGLMSLLDQPIRPLCQEGVALVRQPLPVYPEAAPVSSVQAGEAVAKALGGSKCLVLHGHGLVVAGNSLGDAVVSALQLEEQARMNWLAYCVVGPDYKYLPDIYIEEMIVRTPQFDLPHFKGLTRGGGRDGGALGWSYFRQAAEASMAAEASPA